MAKTKQIELAESRGHKYLGTLFMSPNGNICIWWSAELSDAEITAAEKMLRSIGEDIYGHQLEEPPMPGQAV